MSKTYRCEKCGDMTVKLSDDLIDTLQKSTEKRVIDEVIEFFENQSRSLRTTASLDYAIKKFKQKYGGK